MCNSRDLKAEIEELVQLEKERDKFYSLKCSEMNEFKKEVDKSAEEIGSKVKDLRSAKDKVKKRKLVHACSCFCILVVLLSMICSLSFPNPYDPKF